MNVLKTLILYTSFLLIGSAQSNAQIPKFKEGFIITNAKDTLKGEVKQMAGLASRYKVQFKAEKGKTTYEVGSLLGYHYNNIPYKRMEVDGTYEFVRICTEGKINLYKRKTKNEVYGSFGGNRPTQKLTHSETWLMQFGGQRYVELNDFDYKKRIDAMLADYPELLAKFKRGRYHFGNLTGFVMYCNDFFEKQNSTE